MIRLELSAEQAAVLLSVLEGTLSDLSYEISSTDRLDYRNMLKERRDVLSDVARLLGGSLKATKPIA